MEFSFSKYFRQAKSGDITVSDTFKNISRLLDSVKPKSPIDVPYQIRPPSKDELVLHCVRLANVHLGLEVGELDLQGDLSALDFKEIEAEMITGGLTNILYKVTNTSNKKRVAVRIFGNNTEQFIDRTRERIIQRHLWVRGLAKRIYAHFNGGQIEEWVDGDTMSEEDFQNFKYADLIAKKMYELHNSQGQRELYLQLNPHIKADGEVKFESMLWPSVWKMYGLCLDNLERLQAISGDHFDVMSLRTPMEKLQRICDHVASPVVLCHGDLLNDNIVVNSHGQVSFLDYEYSCFMERAFDIANHFDEYGGFECDWSYLPDEAEQRSFLGNYLGEAATAETVEALYQEIQPFFIAANFYWGLWGLLQCIMSKHNVDFTHYATSRIICGLENYRWETLHE